MPKWPYHLDMSSCKERREGNNSQSRAVTEWLSDLRGVHRRTRLLEKRVSKVVGDGGQVISIRGGIHHLPGFLVIMRWHACISATCCMQHKLESMLVCLQG